jgi:ketosteroid isomerase-like protein
VKQLVDAFYDAFARRDWAAMQAAYHPQVHFSDPVFPDLRGPMAGAMWHMLCERGTDLRIEHRDVVERGDTVHAHWEAWYTFSATGRNVHNVIDAALTVRDGRIVRHIDDFDFWRWSRQALGAPGVLLGWTPIMRDKVRAQAAKGLAAFVRDKPQYRTT